MKRGSTKTKKRELEKYLKKNDLLYLIKDKSNKRTIKAYVELKDVLSNIPTLLKNHKEIEVEVYRGTSDDIKLSIDFGILDMEFRLKELEAKLLSLAIDVRRDLNGKEII